MQRRASPVNSLIITPDTGLKSSGLALGRGYAYTGATIVLCPQVAAMLSAFIRSVFVMLAALIFLAPMGLLAAEETVPKEAVRIEFPTMHKGKPFTSEGWILLPMGKEKVPVMVIMRGGRDVPIAHEWDYAKVLNTIGVGAFVVDGLSPRAAAVKKGEKVDISTGELVRDAFAALVALSTVPRVDIKRVGIMGFSRGAIIANTTALRSRQAPSPAGNAKLSFRLHVMFYPGCATQPYDLKTVGAPMVMLLGEKDEYTGTQNCLLLAEKMKKAGAALEVITYPGAAHGWDREKPWSYPKALSQKECLFEEQPNRTWREKKSKTKGLKALKGPAFEKALQACATRGAQGKPDPATKAKAMEDLKKAVIKALAP